jgi:hypothetical protein
MPQAPKPPQGKAAEDAVLSFIEQWVNALAHLARFAKSNRLVAKHTAALHESLPALAAPSGEIVFKELHGILLVNGAPLRIAAQDTAPVAEFLFVMLKHNLRALRLRGDVGFDDFLDLLERLARPPADETSRFFTTTHLPFGPGIAVELMTALVEPVRPPDAEPPAPAPVAAERPPAEAIRHAGLAAENPRRPAAKERPPEEMNVRVIVRVGALALYGAEVGWAHAPEATVPSQGEKGAVLAAPVGEHELIIRYDQYQVSQTVVVWENNQTAEVDLQKMFDHDGK